MQKKTGVLIALFFSAASALIYEVVATDMLFFHFVKSSYSVSVVVSVFLLGLGVGSFLFYKFQERIKNKTFLFGFLQTIVGIYAFFVLANLDSIVMKFYSLGLFAVSFTILLIPTIFMGAIFPLTVSVFKKEEAVGLIYFVDLIGAVFGSLAAGFFLIPKYGDQISIYSACIINLVSSLIIFRKKERFISVIFLLLIIFNFSFFYNKENPSFREASPYGLVEVDEFNGCLNIDGRCQCSFYDNNTTEVSLVNYVFDSIKKENPSVLNIGLGCGLTLSSILTKTNHVDVVEINPMVVKANRMFSDVLDNGSKLIIEDGFKYLGENEKKYDIILLDVDDPNVMHSSNLFTSEAFRRVRNSLNDGGVFGLWIYPCDFQGYNDIVYSTLKMHFENVYWVDSPIFIASDKELNYEPCSLNSNYEINTLDKKVLSTIFFENCRRGGGFID